MKEGDRIFIIEDDYCDEMGVVEISKNHVLISCSPDQRYASFKLFRREDVYDENNEEYIIDLNPSTRYHPLIKRSSSKAPKISSLLKQEREKFSRQIDKHRQEISKIQEQLNLL